MTEALDKFIDILDNLEDIKTYVQKARVSTIETLKSLDNAKNEKTALLDTLELVIKRNNEQLAAREISITQREKELNAREMNIAQREQSVEKRELSHQKDVENERKVSFVRATLAQLKDKQDELEVINKQLSFYKNQTQILGLLCNKYGLSYETLTVELIEQAINKHSMASHIEPLVQNPKPIMDTAETTEKVPAKKPGRQTKKQLEEAKREEELYRERLKKEQDALAQEAKRREALELEDKLQMEQLEKLIQEQAEEAQAKEEPIEEVQEIEVEDYFYKGNKLYYLERSSGHLYERLDNDEIGEVVGYIDSKGNARFSIKK